jgi:hypothetical protein
MIQVPLRPPSAPRGCGCARLNSSQQVMTMMYAVRHDFSHKMSDADKSSIQQSFQRRIINLCIMATIDWNSPHCDDSVNRIVSYAARGSHEFSPEFPAGCFQDEDSFVVTRD